jgi:hypothetical protein
MVSHMPGPTRQQLEQRVRELEAENADLSDRLDSIFLIVDSDDEEDEDEYEDDEED